MSTSSKPAGPGGTTSNPAISGTGTGMGSATAGGVQAGTVNDAAQGAPAGSGAQPSLGSGMAAPSTGNRSGDAATGGGAGAAPQEPFELPYRVIPRGDEPAR